MRTLVLLLILMAGSITKADALRVGVAVADITPPIGVPLAGYGGGGRRAGLGDAKSRFSTYLKPSVGVRDPIQSKVLYVDNGKQRLVFVSVDMIGASKRMREDILSRLTGFTENELYISGTHTHSGPGAFEKNWLWEILASDDYKEEVYEHLVAGILRSIKLAKLNLQAGSVYHVAFKADGLQSNRRDRPGHYDDEAHLLLARNAKGEWLGGIVNFAIHGTFFGTTNLHYSADVNGAIAAAVERRFTKLNSAAAKTPVFLFINGAEGDVAPRRGYELEQMGELFAAMAASNAEKATKLAPVWSTKQAIVELGAPKVGNCTKTKFGYGVLQTLNPLLLTAFPTRSRTWSLNWDGLHMVTLPGEFTTDLGFAFRQAALAAGARQSMVLGLTNDHLAYFVTASEFWDGGYESCSTFYGENGGQRFVERYREMLK
ncbi:MAG TPA: neutral/alkaline non-lysosomal ceramidase N-terminal domain-containing protein [Bdellovibrionales bacterium]|nr:neutral/alkaline non-lysosomal ceramidase N-terminal domain-containing protein [Bdellovibrionales bacterium]